MLVNLTDNNCHTPIFCLKGAVIYTCYINCLRGASIYTRCISNLTIGVLSHYRYSIYNSEERIHCAQFLVSIYISSNNISAEHTSTIRTCMYKKSIHPCRFFFYHCIPSADRHAYFVQVTQRYICVYNKTDAFVTCTTPRRKDGRKQKKVGGAYDNTC